MLLTLYSLPEILFLEAWSKGFVFMGRVMGCGLCPYNAIEKVGNYATSKKGGTEPNGGTGPGEAAEQPL